jgi:hypothetical protein
MSLIAILAISFTAHAADPVLLKTGREIYASYASILGVNEKDPDTVALYQANASRLPKQGLPSELSNNAVLGVTELSGLFCQKAIAREQGLPASQRNLFTSLNFSKGSEQFDSYTIGKVTEDLAMAFWQRDIKSAEQTAFAKAITTASPGSAAQIAQVLCTLFATSLPTLVR